MQKNRSRMRPTWWVLLIVCSFQASCTTDWDSRPTRHPDYPTITPIRDSEEIQVTWVRAWHPKIYLRAVFESKRSGRKEGAHLYFSLSRQRSPKLKRMSITEEEWQEITNTLESLNFWSEEHRCEEQAYREKTLYERHNDVCEEIIMTDGAFISIAATNGERAKGIRAICDDFENCSPLGRLPQTMLEIVGWGAKL